GQRRLERGAAAHDQGAAVDPDHDRRRTRSRRRVDVEPDLAVPDPLVDVGLRGRESRLRHRPCLPVPDALCYGRATTTLASIVNTTPSGVVWGASAARAASQNAARWSASSAAIRSAPLWKLIRSSAAPNR